MHKGRREELRWAMNTKAFGLIIEYSSGEGFCQTQGTRGVNKTWNMEHSGTSQNTK